jgi:hypothetical protein
MKKDWQIKPSTFFAIVYALTLILLPLPGGLQFVLPFVSIPLFLSLRKKKNITDFKISDFFLILIYMVIGMFAMVYFQVISLASTPLWQILLVGLAADIVASVLGTIPILGDGASGLINVIIAMVVIGGVNGAMIGVTIMVISFLPGPSLGANTMMLLIFKFASNTLIG